MHHEEDILMTYWLHTDMSCQILHTLLPITGHKLTFDVIKISAVKFSILYYLPLVISWMEKLAFDLSKISAAKVSILYWLSVAIRWKEKLAFDPSKVTLLPITGSKFEDEVFCPLVWLTFCHCYREGGREGGREGMEWNGMEWNTNASKNSSSFHWWTS